MKIHPPIMASGLVLSLLLAITACTRTEFFKIGQGTAPPQNLHIGVYADPQHPGNCDVTFPKVNVRLIDTVQWVSLDGNAYTAHFRSGTPFGNGNDKFDTGKQTPKPQVPAGKYYVYEVLMNGSKCKDANDPNDDPGLNIKN